MTLNGAIMQLVEMRENSMMPVMFKPYFDKIIETVSECVEPSEMPHWIPCSERLPEVNEDGESDYILLSCSNYSLPIIGRYQVDDQGGAFYYGDDDKPLVSYGLFVNAWMPLPEPYKEGQE